MARYHCVEITGSPLNANNRFMLRMRKKIKYYLVLFLKGTGIGAANIIPGVSGGTIALITGLFEEIIRSIKSINIKSLKLLLTGRFKEFQKHVNFFFYCWFLAGQPSEYIFWPSSLSRYSSTTHILYGHSSSGLFLHQLFLWVNQ